MSPELKQYLDLEARVLEHIESGDEFSADHVRDMMDYVWQSLSEADHAFLDSRSDDQPEAVED